MAEETSNPNLNGEVTNNSPAMEQNPQSAAQQELSSTATSAPVISDAGDEAGQSRPLPFSVVAIGASAGGVEAFIELFDHLPDNTGLAYVVISHLAADQKSHLVEILSRHTQMPVMEIDQGVQLEPNCVYILPPKAVVQLERGIFRIHPTDSGKPERVIDVFFQSLASDQKAHAIGVVLSGMDSDGALGLRSIKGEGGITMVQAPETAHYPEMPRSCLATDHVDIVLPPSQIALNLASLARQFRETKVRLLQDGPAPSEEDQYFNQIVSMMRSVSGVDFRLYKPNTIRRRIARRLLLHKIDSLQEYVKFLRAKPNELRDLQEDALINVTRFFRDPDVFDAIKNSILQQIFEDRDSSQQLRIWVAGCSSGEEVYSIAMCVLEHLTGSAKEPPIQLFGTDASEISIQKARAGIYPETISAEVSPERLRRFFTKTEKGYQIQKRIRDLCIFARQNLCHDPPFSRMDIISCRNVLIYFGADLQRQVIPTFHYALRQNGFLILGTSETIREFTDLFSLADRRLKIYSRTDTASKQPIFQIASGSLVTSAPAVTPQLPQDIWGEGELQRAADRIMLARYAPPAVIINDRMEIVQSRGRTTPFLELAPGTASLDVLRMTRENIASEVSAAIRQSIEEDLPVQVEHLQVAEGELMREATLEVIPILSVHHRTKCYLVVFAPSRNPLVKSRSPVDIEPSLSNEEKDRLMAQMRRDLASTKLYLQSLLDDRDAKNQELVSANEEIQSANEELQSTNEELETTKEELQSSNEELHTVNEELQHRNTVLKQASDDLLNLINSVNLPVLMLSNDLQIRHFTPPTQRVMNLRSSDIGRPFSELRINLAVEDLSPIFQDVLETLGPREMEVQDREGHWHLLRVRPYRTADNKIDGLVVALVDIDQLRRSQQELRSARDFSRSIIQGVPLPLAVVDLDFRIGATNRAFCSLTQTTNNDLDRRFLPAVTAQVWGLDELLRENLDKLRESRQVGDSFEFEHATSGESPKIFLVRGCVLQPDESQYLLVTFEEITVHKEAERILQKDRERLASEVEATNEALGRSQEELRALTARLFTSQEEERRRIARELHDDISQRLAALEMDGDQIENTIGDSPAKEAFQRIRHQIGTLAEDVRSMSHRLHPSLIEDLGLKPALRTLAEEFGAREGMIATFSSRNVPEEIPIDVATVLYRIAQEALRNVAKHAGQTHVRISLRGSPGGIELQVADFGHGFEASDGHSGLGLLSMEERARQIGATFNVQSSPGEGTRVTVTLKPSRADKTERA